MAALRDFIASLDKRGELVRVHEEVDWKYEIGKMARRSNTPLLFENIKGYQGKRLFANGFANYTSIALALGIQNKGVSFRILKKTVKSSLRRPIEPVLTMSSRLPENTVTQGIDLNVLPVPWWNEADAGRYLGTWHLNISHDPETSVRNVGIYRMQIVSPNQTTVSLSPRSHLVRQISKAERKDEALPMAVAIGVDERLIMSAAAAPEYGVDELALAGALVGRPIEIARCLTQPLEVPTDSEIVIEGFIKPGVRVQDGPFLDYAGIPSTNPHAYLFEVTALLFRDNLIFRGTSVGCPGAEDHQLYSLLSSVGLTDFHGSRIRHFLQTFLLRRRSFRVFQLTGRFGRLARKGKPWDRGK